MQKWLAHPGAQLVDLIINRPDFQTISSNPESNGHYRNKIVGEFYGDLNNFTRYYIDPLTGENKQTVISKLTDRWESFKKRNYLPFNELAEFVLNLADIYYAIRFDKLAYKWEDSHPTMQIYNEIYNYFSNELCDFLFGSDNGVLNENAIAAVELLMRNITANKYYVRSCLIESNETEIKRETRGNLERLITALYLQRQLDIYGISRVEDEEYIQNLRCMES